MPQEQYVVLVWSRIVNKSAAPVATILPDVSTADIAAASKRAVAQEILSAAKRRVMANHMTKKELSDLMETVRRAAYADGYAQAKLDQKKLEAALADVKETGEAHNTQEMLGLGGETSSREQKLENLRALAGKYDETELYQTKATVSMVKAIALDYLRDAGPRLVGPTEIIKNSKIKLNVRISFGTLNRAMAALIEADEVELVEPSRWRLKSNPDSASVRKIRP
jgi:hypothetical protein